MSNMHRHQKFTIRKLTFYLKFVFYQIEFLKKNSSDVNCDAAASDKKSTNTADFLGLWMQHAKHANLFSVCKQTLM